MCSAVYRLRHIFVDERRSADRAEGPENHQSAMAMGNSEAAWDAAYDRNFQRRECQAGVDAMNVWRQHMLNRATQPVANASNAIVVVSNAMPSVGSESE